MRTGIVVTSHNEIVEFEDEITLDKIYKALDDVDDINVIRLSDGIHAYLDGEGLLKPLNPNIVGSVVADSLGWDFSTYPSGVFHGNILFFGGIDDEGDDLPLTDAQAGIILNILSRVAVV